MNQDARTLILGIGNYLMGDEGIGVHIANQLESRVLPDGVDILDGGTGGFHLLEYFEQYSHIILIDATLDRNPVGTIRLIKPKFATDFPPAMSTHDIGLKDLVSALQLLNKMPHIDLFVVSIESIQQQGIELTPEIEAIVPTVIERIFTLLEKKQVAQLI
ncbi:MAG: hydrogenase maturation protease [Sediminibacterium sp.]|nr:MAG: hydrogenase 2 maturation [Chitinophagaceae bacterium]MDP1841871.1 hydrogenase maturation protease [Sediminibacterium sp.]